MTEIISSSVPGAAGGHCTLFILKSKVLLPKGLCFVVVIVCLFVFSIVVPARSEKDQSKLSFLVNEQLSNICQLHASCV